MWNSGGGKLLTSSSKASGCPVFPHITHIVPDDFPRVAQQVHEARNADRVHQDGLLHLLEAVPEHDGEQLDGWPAHVELVVLRREGGLARCEKCF